MIPLEWMPPLMFGGLIVFMLIGYPVAFSLVGARARSSASSSI